jgi:hypothetical protein
MKIKELIEKLKQFDPETLVVVDGQEPTKAKLNNIEEIIIIDSEDTYYDYIEGCDYDKDCKPIKAIYLGN